MTPKQSKDVDSSPYKDELELAPLSDDPPIIYDEPDISSPTPTSLREQLLKLNRQRDAKLNTASQASDDRLLEEITDAEDWYINALEALITTYIEAAELDRAIEELKVVKDIPGKNLYILDRIADLQAQKGVMEKK